MEQLMQDICILCCQTITIYAVGACDHPVCYECSARMRALCHQNECAICRKDLQKVVLTQKLQPFSILNQIRYPLDCECEVYFEDDICQKMYNKLFENICKLCSDKYVFRSYWCLRYHMEEIHKRFYCNLCLKNLRLFTSERKYYTREELDRHISVGDLDDTSHRGHPLCDVCNRRYVDQDKLLRHLHRGHYFCHFCGNDRFYRNYKQLLFHCRRMHYLCEDGQCTNEGFISVFRSEIDLKAHRADHQHEKSFRTADEQETCELDRIIGEDKQDERHHGPMCELGRGEENWPRSSYINNSNLWDDCLESAPSINIENMEEFPPLNPLTRTTKSAPEETNTSSVTKNFATRSKHENILSMDSNDFPILGLSGSCNPVSSESLCPISSLDSRSQKKISPSGKRMISKNDRSIFENSIPSNEILAPFLLEEEFTGLSTTIENKNCPIASKSGNENGHGSNANFNKDCQPFRRNNCKSNTAKLSLIEDTKSNLEEMICSKPSVTIEENPSLTLEKPGNNVFKTKRPETKPHSEFENTTVGNPVIEPSPTFIYTEPPKFKQRKDIFMENIYSYLHGNYWALREFKSLSDRLLQSSITARDFCMKCNDILGHTRFLKFIPEFLVLLPNINKQQDLLSEVQKYFARKPENTGAKPKRYSERDDFVFEVCATCNQILSKNDFGDHKNKAH